MRSPSKSLANPATASEIISEWTLGEGRGGWYLAQAESVLRLHVGRVGQLSCVSRSPERAERAERAADGGRRAHARGSAKCPGRERAGERRAISAEAIRDRHVFVTTRDLCLIPCHESVVALRAYTLFGGRGPDAGFSAFEYPLPPREVMLELRPMY